MTKSIDEPIYENAPIPLSELWDKYQSLDKHEKEVINAYRNADKSVKDGVDRFLGIEPLVTGQ